MDKIGSTPAATGARLELAAMEDIAELLARLPDAAARNRVLRWAEALVYQDEATPTSAPGAKPLHLVRSAALQESTEHAQEDPDLSLGDLKDWFDRKSTPPPDDRLSDSVGMPPVVSMIHGFVEDFQKLAHDWQGD